MRFCKKMILILIIILLLLCVNVVAEGTEAIDAMSGMEDVTVPDELRRSR